jgi:hypothetical protein
MNECLVNNIIPDLLHIRSLNLLIISFELVIPISNKKKIKIIKNNIKRIYLKNNLNDQDLVYISIHYIILKKEK